MINNPAFNNECEQAFIYQLITIIGKTPNFEFALEFLGKKERELIGNVIGGLDKVSEEKRQEAMRSFKL